MIIIKKFFSIWIYVDSENILLNYIKYQDNINFVMQNRTFSCEIIITVINYSKVQKLHQTDCFPLYQIKCDFFFWRLINDRGILKFGGS